MRRAFLGGLVALFLCSAVSAATVERSFPARDAWVDVRGTIVSCSWQRNRVEFVSCDLRGAGDRFAATISNEGVAVFRFTDGRSTRLVVEWRHASQATSAAAEGPSRSAASEHRPSAASYAFPLSGSYLRVPGTSIGCAAGSLQARKLAICHLQDAAGRYAFALGETYVTVLRFPAGGERPVVVWGRRQPAS